MSGVSKCPICGKDPEVWCREDEIRIRIVCCKHAAYSTSGWNQYAAAMLLAPALLKERHLEKDLGFETPEEQHTAYMAAVNEVNILLAVVTPPEQTDYEKYRGKCKEAVEALVKQDPTLTAVRGFYHCPFWGKQAHWWAVDTQGKIIDPTVKQFPSKGVGAEYEEFDGICECAQCGRKVPEEKATINGNYAFCSTPCAMRFVGL